ncbi:hypothetical protein C8F04DRAFT_1289945 [Mycena alexandri]|uniref:Uncharacterized protein n=1 Tax=Mycena alexandri TaxID=1745969 RepID=A0AAD6TB66_9AGAR|nr:hypothetical protein C8F04DRAFT_1289945 [Mycena alexandri]
MTPTIMRLFIDDRVRPRLPNVLKTNIMNRLKLRRPRQVALGFFVVSYDDSTLSRNLQGMYSTLQPLLDKSITCIALSPYFAGHYFVAFSDGSAQRNLPQEMHTDVKDVVGSPRPFPAAAPAQTLLGATLKYQLAVHTGMALNRMFRTCWS